MCKYFPCTTVALESLTPGALRSPCLFSSLLGLINTIIALSTHHGEESLLGSSVFAALILSITSSTIYLTLSLLTFRKIHIVRERDAMHRHHPDGESYHLLPEDEMQRQQLLRLLQQRENKNNNKSQQPGSSSAEASESTFRIDLPDSPKRMETRLTTPQSIYENRRNENTYNSRSPNFSPLSPFLGGSRRTPSSYEPLTEHNHGRVQEQASPPQLPQIPVDTSSPLTERAFSRSSRATAAAAPPYTPGDVEAPIEKRGELADLAGEVHPLERDQEREQQRECEQEEQRERARPQYRVVDAPAADPSRLLGPGPVPGKKDRGGELRRQRSTSRESRRAEIELERGGGNAGRGGGRAELEGVKVSPRIVRVETDGWGRR